MSVLDIIQELDTTTKDALIGLIKEESGCYEPSPDGGYRRLYSPDYVTVREVEALLIPVIQEARIPVENPAYKAVMDEMGYSEEDVEAALRWYVKKVADEL